ncbi:B12-binding domain-containing radical SAM protein [candidate division CSSED10-310 bacterium]|uniref:B12-binding domain-containing radical SAM protein n=1 Tax=candidate division CSSED10-310 bacterium TaxID=2855610 RepID=A0ABV6YZ26_UNCC1
MRILLIQSLTKNFRPIFPIGLARIASLIQDKHQIKIFDPNIEQNIRGTLLQILVDFKPDVVGISLRSIDSVTYLAREYFYTDFVRLIRFIRMTKPNLKIVVGGGGFSLFAQEIMQENPEIDIGVFLEGEETFAELLDHFDDCRQVKGLFIRNNSEIFFTGNRNFLDFEKLPFPAYKLFQIEKYPSKDGAIGIESKRGCALKCAYCPYPFLNGQNVRIRSAAAVVDEIEFLVSTYDLKKFSFIDSVFNIPVEHSINICQEILKRELNVRWSGWINEKAFDEEYARLAVSAGCVNLPFSTDGFSDKSLQLLGKNFRNKDILKTVEIAKKIDGINISYNFFLNPPGTSLKTFFQMFLFLIKSKWILGRKMKGFKSFLFNRIRIEPHTKIRDRAIKEDLIKSDTNLLTPMFYSHPSTRVLEIIFDLVSWPLDLWSKFRRFMKFGIKRREMGGTQETLMTRSRIKSQ